MDKCSVFVEALSIVQMGANAAQNQNGGGLLVITILTFNFTRLIYGPIHIFNIKQHYNATLKDT